MSSRRYILNRRGEGISDLSSFTITTGEYSLEEAVIAGLYKVNCTHQIGIATATEVGLQADRFPIRVVIGSEARTDRAVDTVCRYWKVVTFAGEPVTFQRKPLVSDMAIKALYSTGSDLDAMLWGAVAAANGQAQTVGLLEDLTPVQEALYALLITPEPTMEQKIAINAHMIDIIQKCTAANHAPYFKITTDHMLVGVPHGVGYVAQGAVAANRVAVNEVAACISLNYSRMKARYPTLSDGVVTCAAYCVANMFRFGLFESYEHTEYITVNLTPSQTNASHFTIASVRTPPGAQIPAGITVGSTVDLTRSKLSITVQEYCSCLVWSSGLMHYLFNHTTGGSVVTGPLLTTLAMYRFVSPNTNDADLTNITSLFYEALHPTNKRAIANIFFPSAEVTTHGRLRGSPKYERFVLDQFAKIRSNPYPAGSHKAYVCLMALRRVLQSGMGPFLPWASELNMCIAAAKDTLQNGARAHIGSAYYTGEPAISQSSTLDNYLPELAFYIQNFNKGDSLAMSPHLSPEVAARSNMNWTNLLKELKTKDVSAIRPEVVKEFLSTQGSAMFSFDPDDKATWSGASTVANSALASIKNIFN